MIIRIHIETKKKPCLDMCELKSPENEQQLLSSSSVFYCRDLMKRDTYQEP
jgi:hypothetical protein